MKLIDSSQTETEQFSIIHCARCAGVRRAAKVCSIRRKQNKLMKMRI